MSKQGKRGLSPELRFPFDNGDTVMLLEYLAVGSAIGTAFLGLVVIMP